MPTKRDLQKVATRQHLLGVAHRLFQAVGYEAATIRDIAVAANRSTGAVFGHWSGKAELYRDLYGHDPLTPEQGRSLTTALSYAASIIRGSGYWTSECDDVIGKALADLHAGLAVPTDEREAA